MFCIFPSFAFQETTSKQKHEEQFGVAWTEEERAEEEAAAMRERNEAEDRARQEGQGIDESVVEGIRALISQHQTIAWQAVLGHVVTQLVLAAILKA